MLTPQNVYTLFPILGAIFGAMLWLGYFKKIDLFEKEKPKNLAIAFTLGYLTPTLTLWVYLVGEILGFNFNGNFYNDLIYSIFGVGLIEELTKLLAILIVLRLVKHSINEPLDYLIYAGIVALGFSIRENYIHFNNYGSQIITGRTFISCLVHIINSSICVYGIYRFKLFNKGNNTINAVVGVSLAIVSHGLFDFFLTLKIADLYTPIFSTIIYLIGINFWIQMLNNAINFSPFFNYQKTLITTTLYKTIIGWYTAIGFLEFFYLWYFRDIEFAFNATLKNFLQEGVLLLIVALRASKLQLNKRKYFPVKIQLPIQLTKYKDENINFLGILPLKVRGESKHEFRFFNLMEKQLYINAINDSSELIPSKLACRIIKKHYLKDDVVIFSIDIWFSDKATPQHYYIKPKTHSVTLVNKLHPIGKLLSYPPEKLPITNYQTISYFEFTPLENVYLTEFKK